MFFQNSLKKNKDKAKMSGIFERRILI